MLVNKAVQLAVLAAAMLLESRTDAATSPSVRFCGRQLSEIMSRVCHAYNSPWDTPTGNIYIFNFFIQLFEVKWPIDKTYFRCINYL